MQNYIFSITAAFFTFPIIAMFFTFPYIIYQYRKYGSILFMKALIVYSFILYLLTVYFLVILPLPQIKDVINYKGDYLQLIPFNFVNDFINKSNFVLNNPSTYIDALKSSSFYNTFFNIIMTIPFGIYLRYYFGLNFKKTLLYSFLLSLFFEFTQLTGLYGIYPRPYRIFDVDDLMTNTLGGSIGYLLTPLICTILPSRESLEEKAYEKGKEISYFRRFIAISIDFIFSSFLLIFLFSISNKFLVNYILTIIFYFIIIPYTTKGYTIGKKVVKIKIVKENGDNINLINIIIRSFLLYILYIPIPLYIIYLFSFNNFLISILLIFGLFILFIYLSFNLLFGLLFKRKLFYEKYSQTKQISTVIWKNSTLM